ncbi:MAG: hypothetical protein WBD51_09880, partial [Burkholderiaceae bacterium]
TDAIIGILPVILECNPMVMTVFSQPGSKNPVGHFVRLTALLLALCLPQPGVAQQAPDIKFQRIPVQFIAALGDPGATGGDNAQLWGIWREDPGPRGVSLHYLHRLTEKNRVTPAGWQFDPNEWWLEENGLVMERPSVPLPPGNYLVTGDRETTAVLTIEKTKGTGKADTSGPTRWTLHSGAKLHDVTHLGCRSARYTPLTAAGSTCSPAQAPVEEFRVDPGAEMPPVPGCQKQDFAVLFVVGIAPLQ